MTREERMMQRGDVMKKLLFLMFITSPLLAGTHVMQGDALSVSSLTVTNLTSGECVQTTAGGTLSTTGSACGAGGGSGVTLSSFSASTPIQYNNSTGDFSLIPVSLSTGVVGTLPVANGGTNLTASSDDNVMVGNGTTWQSKAIADCDDSGGNHLNYDTGTNAFSCGTSGGAGAAASSDLTDCKMSYGSATVLNIAACPVGVGNSPYDEVAAVASSTAPLGSGTLRAYIAVDGTPTLGFSGASSTTFTGWTGALSVTAFPDDSYAIAIASYTTGVWVSSVLDKRRLIRRDVYAPGTALTSSCTGGACTFDVVTTSLGAGTTIQAGVLEISTAAEINTGTDDSRVISPKGLSGSIFGQRVVEIEAVPVASATWVGDGKAYFRIPPALNGMNLVGVAANVYTAGTTNTTDVQIARCAAAASGNICSGTVADMLSTKITIDSGENDTTTAATTAVINTSNDDVVTGQVIRIDLDAISTTPAQGLLVTLTFQLP